MILWCLFDQVLNSIIKGQFSSENACYNLIKVDNLLTVRIFYNLYTSLLQILDVKKGCKLITPGWYIVLGPLLQSLSHHFEYCHTPEMECWSVTGHSPAICQVTSRIYPHPFISQGREKDCKRKDYITETQHKRTTERAAPWTTQSRVKRINH